jgi:hypothetical protein
MSRTSLARWFIFVIILAIGHTARAQSIGTFRWQLQPYCNLVTLSVTQAGGVYTVDGFDDQCGAATGVPVTGAAVPNPDGTIEIGFGIVASPDARPVHVAVVINKATLGGTWTDSAGHSGTFAFKPDGGTGGAPRRAATGAIGAAELNAGPAQLRVSGTCSSGQALSPIEQNGTVACAPAGSCDISAAVTPEGSGLAGGSTAGATSLGLARVSGQGFDFSNCDDFGSQINSLYPKAVIRAGMVSGNHWDEAHLGGASAGLGLERLPAGPPPAPSGAASASVGDYREVYRRAINAKNRKQWKDAAGLFQQSLQLRGTDTGERVSITGFGNIEPYVPHYYLGLALMNLGDCSGALQNWELAERDGAIQRTNLYRSLLDGRKTCTR